MRDETIGKVVLGRYRVVRPLARGGMGVVYLGRTEGAAGFSKPVVIKRILPQLLNDPEMAQMFVREARILSHLHHPGIVGVVDFGEEDDAYVMVLEYVHGYDVGLWRKYLSEAKQPMPTEVAVHIVIRVLDALHYAHNLKRPDGSALMVIHRDVSPGNILLDAEGHVRLLDFGIARIANETGEYKTQEGTFKGKLGYASPELLKGKDPSPQSDLYSCAVVLLQLLTGRNPYRGATTAETLQRILTTKPPALENRLKDAPQGLDRVMAKALEKDVAARYASAAEFADALRLLRQSSENAISTLLAEHLHHDFNGPMPKTLGLEPLQARDVAWREISGEHSLRSSLPPHQLDATKRVDVTDYDAQDIHDVPTTVEPNPEAIGRTPAALTTAPLAPTSGNKGTTIAIAALALAVAGVAAAIVLRPEQEDTGSRYLVVTKDGPVVTKDSPINAAEGEHDNNGTESSATATSAASSTATTEATAPTTTKPSEPSSNSKLPSTPPPSNSGPKKPDPRALTRTFASRQGAVQACFGANREQAEKTPSLQIAFKVSASGSVSSASLLPASLNGTPLGGCILRVAKSTKFGALTESVAFRIPVQARQK